MKRLVRTATALAILALLGVGAGAAPVLACDEADLLEHARQVKARHQYALLAAPGVVGVGVGRAPDTGEAAIQLYVAGPADEARLALPTELEGVRVVIIESDGFRPRSE